MFLVKEKYFELVVCKILLKEMVDFVCKKGFCLVYLYGFFKMYKIIFVMWLIFLVIGIYNYVFVKWLDEKLKFLLINEYIIFDVFNFVEEI